MAKFFEFFSGKRKRRRRAAEPQNEETRQLQRQLERGAQDVSLSRLKKQGLNRLKVINANTIKGIVNDAVDEAIRLRAVSLTGDEREQIQDMARAQLGEVLEENRRLTERVGEASTRAEEFEALVTSLGAELRAQEAALEAERSKQVRVEVAEESFAELERRLKLTFERLVRDRELLQRDGDGLALHLDPLESELEAAITRLVSEARTKEQEGIHEDRAQRIETLERRIQKLDQALAEAETNLQRAHMGGDFGVASVYTDVQGLSANDPNYKKKGGLLGEVFLQNLELQGVEATPDELKAVGAIAPPPPPSPVFPPLPEDDLDAGVAF